MKEQEINDLEKELIEEINEEEIKDFVSEILGKKDEGEELPIELSREQFFLEVKGAYDYHVKKREDSDKQIEIAVNLINTANMFEQDPGLRVGYLKFPDGLLGLSVEPKDEMGFKIDER